LARMALMQRTALRPARTSVAATMGAFALRSMASGNA
jgi:tRNA (Thr-GGU) A37 N-methylase